MVRRGSAIGEGMQGPPENHLTVYNAPGMFFCMARRSRNYRHFKDTRRAHLLREHSARLISSSGDGDSLPAMEELCQGGGNVFAELGLLHPEQELLKALLTIQLCRIIKERHITQVQAAALLGITQQQVSALTNNRLSKFSVGRLFELIVALGQDVEIALRPAVASRGEISLIQRAPCPVGPHRTFLSGLTRFRSLFVRSQDDNH